MLSGQGRHRRPRQVPAILVTAGVTGSAIAIPLLGASSASAADAETWDKVAECESGGAWSAKGSGYYGGLQLTQDTWEQYGGLSYAPTADQASRSQQIHVAENVLADRGPDAWPNCAPAAGLTTGGAAADVDPGLPTTPPRPADSDESTTSGKGEDEGKGKEKDKGEEKDAKGGREDAAADADGSEKAEKPGSSADARDKSHEADGRDGGADRADEGGKSDERGGKHRKPAADGSDKSGADDSASPRESDSAGPGTDDASESGSSGRHRGDRADENAPSGDTGPGRHASRGDARDVPGAERPAGTYTVRSGDNLSAIADSHDLDGGWTDLYAGNKKTVGSDPDLILPGQRLELSADDKEVTEGKPGGK
ncbi:transglycosylase family protein [Streptomyces sp. AN091965]|uniref:transglycosylase family protein n=1 Tax=Streptomyces sp. AN091965 TaxID=2927803 RepID=UPI001F60680E|nr:transglycosylase family protein [Streptomyces sp. AN091965]MCI3931172.1 transglycosylase family protein [Streptomyces sp. AN091965]